MLLGLVCACAGPQGGGAVQSCRCQGPPEIGHPRSQPGARVGKRDSLWRLGAGAKSRGLDCPDRQGKDRAPRQPRTIVSFARGMTYALEAAEELAGEGIEAEVIDLRSLRPLDLETIIASVQ